jgi:peptide/nickel transport system permease protein
MNFLQQKVPFLQKKKKREEEKLFVASQWQLIRWKFFRHKLAMGALAVLTIMYIFAIFAEFTSPNDPHNYDIRYMFAPPQRLRFFDETGRFHLRPFVYGIKAVKDEVTLKINYIEEKENKHPLHFFVTGDPYKLLGFIKGDIHLFGIREERMYLFGADKMGRDMLSRIIFGSRISLTVGLAGIAISFILGIIIGGISGYIGGTVDVLLQRFIEFLRSLPTLPLWMGLSAALPPDWPMVKVYFGIVLILSLMGWTGLARVVRGKFMALREEDFVMAAEAHGAGKARIIFKHLLPSFYSYIIARITLAVPGMILGETALSFLGLGLQAPAISWGVLLKDAQAIRILALAPWLLIPGIFVVIAILAFNFVGDGLRDAADPYTAV